MGGFNDVPAGIDARVPSVARMYDYYLGGKDNFASDREAAEKMIEIGRQMGNDTREIARANRRFLGKAVTLLAKAGVRQFIDIGAGLPTQDNVHQVARRHVPDARVVYVDNDPIVLIHARALLAGDTDVIAVQGDARRPEAIFDDPKVTGHLDLTQPFAVLMVAVLHFIVDDAEASRITATVRDRLVPDGHLVLSHLYEGNADDDVTRASQLIYRRRPPAASPGAASTRSPASSTAWTCSRRASSRSRTGTRRHLRRPSTWYARASWQAWPAPAERHASVRRLLGGTISPESLVCRGPRLPPGQCSSRMRRGRGALR
jgi:hypothetical protein